MLIERYCSCGCVLKRDIPRRKKTQALAVWSAAHSGPGHEPTDAAGAEMARTGSGQPDGRDARRGQP